jgi:hypothetical protein
VSQPMVVAPRPVLTEVVHEQQPGLDVVAVKSAATVTRILVVREFRERHRAAVGRRRIGETIGVEIGPSDGRPRCELTSVRRAPCRAR